MDKPESNEESSLMIGLLSVMLLLQTAVSVINDVLEAIKMGIQLAKGILMAANLVAARKLIVSRK